MLGKCPCCEILKDENKHLRELVDRLMQQIAPLAPEAKDDVDVLDPRLASEIDDTSGRTGSVIRYGEGS